MVPALHLWMLATLVDPPPGRRTRLAMVAGGLVLPLLLVLYQLLVLGLNPLAGAWYLLLLVTGGHIGLVSSLLGCLFAGVLTGVIAVARSDPPEAPRPPREVPKVRGPATYAGPGLAGRHRLRAEALMAGAIIHPSTDARPIGRARREPAAIGRACTETCASASRTAPTASTPAWWPRR